MEPDLRATRSVLIVVDDELALQTYEKFLQVEGYEVRTATSAEMGFQEIERRWPDAIILDLRLPETGDGLAFLRQLRAQAHGTTPVAVVTGDYGLDDRVESEIRALGASITFKPLSLDELGELVAVLVRETP